MNHDYVGKLINSDVKLLHLLGVLGITKHVTMQLNELKYDVSLVGVLNVELPLIPDLLTDINAEILLLGDSIIDLEDYDEHILLCIVDIIRKSVLTPFTLRFKALGTVMTVTYNSRNTVYDDDMPQKPYSNIVVSCPDPIVIHLVNVYGLLNSDIYDSEYNYIKETGLVKHLNNLVYLYSHSVKYWKDTHNTIFKTIYDYDMLDNELQRLLINRSYMPHYIINIPKWCLTLFRQIVEYMNTKNPSKLDDIIYSYTMFEHYMLCQQAEY